MRILVFFDLPVKTKAQRKAATGFRNYLLKDGYHMVQFSIYARVCNSIEATNKHEARLRVNLPKNGSVRLLIITEKQYNGIKILVGEASVYDKPISYEQLTIF